MSSQRREDFEPDPAPPAKEPSLGLPRCPDCGKPRTAVCPFCGTAGNQFALADEIPPAPRVDVFHPSTAATGAGCGPGGCGLPQCGGDRAAVDRLDAPADAEADLGPMVICPLCDEPFRPAFTRRCEWCGHEFPDGCELPPLVTTVEPLNARMFAVIVALAVLVGGILIYFSRLI